MPGILSSMKPALKIAYKTPFPSGSGRAMLIHTNGLIRINHSRRTHVE